MLRLTTQQIIEKIDAEDTFHAVSSDYSFTLKIESYVHYVCGAVHNGHQFRKDLWDICMHSEYDRWYEEDPETKTMVKSHPIVIAGMDSRFEYDLNRAPENAIYDDAWGKKLWKNPLPKHQKEKSLAKHKAFYKVVAALISKIEAKFGICLVYDMHSYNWKRWDRKVPTWNLGTSNVDQNRFAKAIEMWSKSLSELQLPHGIESTSLINDTFQGNGYFLQFITQNFKNTLVLATEIAKVYCNEYDYIIFPEVVASIEKQMRTRLVEHANAFYNRHK